MNRDILYRFFEGTTTLSEEKEVRKWMESSEENFKVYLDERKIYDAMLLTNPDKLYNRTRRTSLYYWISGSVAAVIITLIIGGLYLFNKKDSVELYNTIIVPPGQRINMVLSDNSNIWLNSNTKFKYPTQFSKENRTVYLDGEGFFDVSSDTKKPFIVKTDQGDIHVTGTSFNVEAYSRFKNFETSLFEGGVDIYNGDRMLTSLKPNEKSSLENNQLIISNISDTDKYLWKDGLIAFNNKRLEDILVSLEKYFDIDIQINTNNMPQRTYTGKFRQSDGVDYALRVLQKSIKFSYDRDEETGIIYIR